MSRLHSDHGYGYLGLPPEAGRDYLDEAKRILAGATAILPEKRHLEALQELHECVLIRLASKVTQLHHEVMESD